MPHIAARNISKQKLHAAAFDVCIIGGGIHGVSVARDAALRGYRVVLLEKNDFASGTSSRSSKMLHGGIRYLEQGNIGLVKTALQERNFYLNAAPHLCRVQEFFFPIIPGRTRGALLTRLGLGLYDVLARVAGGPRKIPRHHPVARSNWDLVSLSEYGLKAKQVFSYYDGQMDDARLVVETACDAVRLGAVLMNYADLCQVTQAKDSSTVTWRDALTGEAAKFSAKVIVNAAGPWAPQVAGLCGAAPLKVCYSRGTHLLFAREWKHPGLILPTQTKGRYYFVWPYFSPFGALTLVGTTDVELSQNEESPEPSQEEIAELLALIAADLPAAGLNAKSLVGSFAGVRILGLTEQRGWRKIFAKKAASVSDVSREEIIQVDGSVVTLIGGKYTSARKTAEQMVDAVDELFGMTRNHAAAREALQRPLPGGVNYNAAKIEQIAKELEQKNLSRGLDAQLSKALAKRAVARFGMRAAELLSVAIPPAQFHAALLPCMVEEIAFCLQNEFVVSQQDLLRRRLGLELDNVNLEPIRRLLDQWEIPSKAATAKR